MKPGLPISILAVLASLALVSADAIAGKGGKNGKRGNTSVSTTLDETEASHLTFMREEEKLARDVYLTFAKMYPNQRTFSNIATRAEQTHTDTMRDRLDMYNLEDPNPETNDRDSSGELSTIGFFTGEEWGSYFEGKFKLLTEWGAESELDALMAGAFIEELDMHDIAFCPEVMTEAGYGIVETRNNNTSIGACGLDYTDESGLISAYTALISGSESHLRAYVGQIEAITGEDYKAQYLTQEEVDTILAR